MGVVRGVSSCQRRRRVVEMEEYKGGAAAMLACAGLQGGKGPQGNGGGAVEESLIDGEEKVVCVTSGASYLGLAIVNRLLLCGYSVCVIVHTQEEKEKLIEMMSGEEERRNKVERVVVVAKLSHTQEELVEALEGCRGVFHTSAFTDPAGLSGYSKLMADIEVKATENVMEACAGTTSVRNCVLTSSLSSCIWKEITSHDAHPTVIDHNSWSHDSFCSEKKLWYGLGKLRAEKAAWKIAMERGLRLTTICPGLITGPDFPQTNSTPTIAYLKGAGEMFANGLLATVDVDSLAEAHVRVYEAMISTTASGRYLCFDRVVRRQDEAQELALMVGFPADNISGYGPGLNSGRFELSKRKLSTLVSRSYHQRSCVKKFHL